MSSPKIRWKAIRCEQGTKIGRRSILHVQISGESIEVGGYVTPLVEATMRF
jgi:predicted PhzF superfamily epimerase YddE/YHI9